MNHSDFDLFAIETISKFKKLHENGKPFLEILHELFKLTGEETFNDLPIDDTPSWDLSMKKETRKEPKTEEENVVFIRMKTIVKARNKVLKLPEKVFVPKKYPTPTNEEEEIETKMKMAKDKEDWNRYHSQKLKGIETDFKPYIAKSANYSTTSLWIFRRERFQNDLSMWNLYQQEVLKPIEEEAKEKDPKWYCNNWWNGDHKDVEKYLEHKKGKCDNCSIIHRTNKSLERMIEILKKENIELKEKLSKQKEQLDSIQSILLQKF